MYNHVHHQWYNEKVRIKYNTHVYNYIIIFQVITSPLYLRWSVIWRISNWRTSYSCRAMQFDSVRWVRLFNYWGWPSNKNKLWPDLKKPAFHTHNIKLMISPEMNYWLNAPSYSTAGLAPKPRVWFLWQLFLDPV